MKYYLQTSGLSRGFITMLSRAQGFLERASQAAVMGGEETGGLAADIRSPYVHFTYHASCALGLPLFQ